MNVQAIIFGGIGTLVETSELQRQAFNQAFEEAGIPWHWDIALYRRLLSTPGGQNRIRHYAASRQSGDAPSDEQVRALHARKTELFREALGRARLEARGGVQRLINQARNNDVRVAIASTTSKANISALLDSSRLENRLFDAVLHRGDVERPKPDAEVYVECLRQLGITAQHAVAVEDSDSGVEAAIAAGVACIALPGENTAWQDFNEASLVVGDHTAGAGSPRQERFEPRNTGLTLATCEALVAAIR